MAGTVGPAATPGKEKNHSTLIPQTVDVGSFCRATGISGASWKLSACLPACRRRLRFQDRQRKVRIESINGPILLGKAGGDGMLAAALEQMSVTVVDDEPAARDVLV